MSRRSLVGRLTIVAVLVDGVPDLVACLVLADLVDRLMVFHASNGSTMIHPRDHFPFA